MRDTNSVKRVERVERVERAKRVERVEHPWEARPVRDRALRHSVQEHVLAAVRAGQLTPGARVHEVSLARALNVSLSPVREALFRLTDQGWLEHRPRRGFYVRSLTPEETAEIYTFRALLEGFAAHSLAERWAHGVPEEDQVVVNALEQAIAEGERVGLAGDRLAVGASNAAFHDTLIQAAEHSLLARSWALLAPAEWLLIPTWGTELPPIGEAEVVDWVARHRRVLQHLLAGDPAAAQRVASTHVRVAGADNVRRRFPQLHHQPPSAAAEDNGGAPGA